MDQECLRCTISVITLTGRATAPPRTEVFLDARQQRLVELDRAIVIQMMTA